MIGLDTAILISLLALLLSLLTFVLSERRAGRAERRAQRADARSQRPVLVFQYDPVHGWSLSNVGTGPAVNVTVGARRSPQSDWTHLTRLHALGVGSTARIHWALHDNLHDFAAQYTDADSRSYSVVAADERNSQRDDPVFDDSISRSVPAFARAKRPLIESGDPIGTPLASASAAFADSERINHDVEEEIEAE